MIPPPTGVTDRHPLRPGLPIVVLLCAMVLLFRTAAWLNPSSFVVIPPSVSLPLNLLGVLFLVCGVWVWRTRPSALARVFLAVGIGSAVHWGGSIGSENPGVEIAFLVFYMGLTVIADGAFLDLSLRYPREKRWGSFPTMGFYLPGIVTLLAVPIAPFLPTESVDAGLGLAIMVALGMSTAAGVVFLVKWFRATRDERRQVHLTPIVVALVVTFLIDLVAGEGGALPGPSEAWTLPYGIVPLVFAWALTRLPKVTGD